MPNSLSSIIQYFHDCYRSDNRDLLLYDFLDRKVEERVYMEGDEELLTAEYPITAIDSAKASTILKKLEVFQKEKELLYGAFFICGHYVDFRGETKRLCAPLFYYPAEIELKDEYHYLSIRAEERRLNYPLISLLSKDSDEDILHDPLFKELPKDFIRVENLGVILKLFQKYFPTVDTGNLYHYPQQASLKEIKSTIAKLPTDDLDKKVLLPTSMLGIVAKSSNTRGVLNELTEMVSHQDYSTPLMTLFNDGLYDTKPKKYQKGNLPMVLSEAQEAILKSSSIHPLTLIVGPPGTGKTYTIGAIAIEHMNRGESVLIASRTDEAVDVIASKIESQIRTGKCVVRGGKKRTYSTPFNRYLKALLTRVHPLKYLLKEFENTEKLGKADLARMASVLSKKVEAQSEEIKKTEALFLKEAVNEKNWGKHLSNEKYGFLGKLKTKYISLRNKFQTPIWNYSQQLFKKDNTQISDVLKFIHLKYIQQVITVLDKNWEDMKFFREALMMSSDTEKLNKFRQINFNAVLKAFPIWLTNLSEVKDVLPFQKEMFDVVIIDEATQCDIASCLPIIQRAKRVVFAGDPNQLRHISFLSRGIQAILRNKYELQQVDNGKLDYRDKSILDLAMNSLTSGEQVAMLDEHFRSISPIIAFSNQHFYDNELRVMTARPDEDEQGLYFIQCGGERAKNGENAKEATQLLQDIRQLVDKEQGLSADLSTSIGILSPFRAQVDLLAKMLLAQFTMPEIEKHQIRVGTAYSFQGEERDQMFLSFAVDAQSHHAAFQHINKEDVFNVAITRARSRQFVYISISTTDLKGGSLLRAYLSQPKKGEIGNDQNKREHDQFLEQVKVALSDWGIETIWTGFNIAGLQLDLLLKQNGKYLGIDLVGYPGEFSETFGIERYRVLNRAGIRTFPLPYSDWYLEHKKTANALKEFVMGTHD